MGDKFLINLDIIRNTNRSLQNQKKKNLSILWKLIWMIIIWTVNWQRYQQIHRKGVTQIEVLIIAEEEKPIRYVSD